MYPFSLRRTLLSLFIVGAAVLPAPSADPYLPTLFIVGDSTVKNRTKGLQGWGDPLAALFDPARIKVENRALGGRSSRTFLTEGLWDKALAGMKPGDFVLIQFGHNDGGPLDSGRARASLKGTGDETREVTDPKSGAREVVHTYGWYLRKYVTDAKAKGARPIVVSLVPRNIWKDGHVARASKDYGRWAAEAARAGGGLFIDLNELVAKRYEEAGPEKVKSAYFGEDHTHTTPAGAELTAAVLAEAIRGLKDCPLAGFMKVGK
jgi:lysophospholipase L1-like esterase